MVERVNFHYHVQSCHQQMYQIATNQECSCANPIQAAPPRKTFTRWYNTKELNTMHFLPSELWEVFSRFIGQSDGVVYFLVNKSVNIVDMILAADQRSCTGLGAKRWGYAPKRRILLFSLSWLRSYPSQQ